MKDRVGNLIVKTNITSTNPTAVIPATSGFAPSINQIFIYNQDGNIRKVYLHFSQIIEQAVGPSGTIIIDMPTPETMGNGSGLFANLDIAGSVDISARYTLYDERTPVNLNYLTHNPRVIRKPNVRGSQ